MTALQTMHVAKRELGLEDDDYRAVLQRVTGKNSARLMTVIEHRLCVDEFRRLGFQQKSRLSGPYAGKLQALWLSAYNLGIVRNRDDKALIAFVDRQTGIGHVKWVREAHHASKAIEGLKAWIAREAPIAWPDTTDARTNKLAVIAAQYAILGNPFPTDADAIWQGNAILDGIISGLGEEIRKGKANV